MDQLWKDFTLSSSLLPSDTATSADGPPHSGLIFQEFLTRVSRKDSQLKADSDHELRNIISQSETSPFSVPSAAAGLLPCSGGRKRVPAIDENGMDKKRTRLMKNRESAVRSRARRQAYTYELESKVSRLVEQNANLKKQLEQLSVGAFGDEQYPKKNKLCRTLSSPF